MNDEIGKGMGAATDAMQSLYSKTLGAKPFVFDVGNSMEHSFVIGPTGAGMSTADYLALKLTDAEVNRIAVGKPLTEGVVDAAAVEMAQAIQQLYVEYPDWLRANVEVEVAAIFTTFNEGGQVIRTETLCDEFHRRHPR
jgi:hypothetical protein